MPTVYQYNSIRAIGLPVTQHKDGSYTCFSIYKTKKDAEEFLTNVASRLAENEKEFRAMKKSIKKGYFRYDAVMVNIWRLFY